VKLFRLVQSALLHIDFAQDALALHVVLIQRECLLCVLDSLGACYFGLVRKLAQYRLAQRARFPGISLCEPRIDLDSLVE
jgi:hypothetical protein